MKNNQPEFITGNELLVHWQGHRRLTRRTIEIFPEDKLFTHSIGGMRTFAGMVKELTGIAGNGIHGITTGHWNALSKLDYHTETSPLSVAKTREELLTFWDEVTAEINNLWPQIPPGRFRQTDTAFGLYEGDVWAHILYFIDNENHHRGQAYVYLRSLGIEPPFFWERQ